MFYRLQNYSDGGQSKWRFGEKDVLDLDEETELLLPIRPLLFLDSGQKRADYSSGSVFRF